MPELNDARLGGDDFTTATGLIRSLIETRSFRKERLDEPQVAAALRVLAKAIEEQDAGERRLAAISLLGKAGEVSVPIARVVHDLVASALKSELPVTGSWGNAEDRYYLAKGLSASRALWIGQYAAKELARAEIAEVSSREVWANLAINRAESLAAALGSVAEALAEQLSGQGDATVLAYRKLVRICQALTQTLPTADVPTGDGFGRAFARLIGQAGGGKGAEASKAREDAAGSVMDLLVQILRLRFDALFDSDIYRAAGSVRGWWRPARPPSEVETKADRIAGLAVDGLHILARQGVRDDELRRTLAKALDPARINAAGKAVASADPSLDPNASKWLATGQELPEARSNEAVREVNEQALDEILARLILVVQDEDAGARALKIVADEIEIFEPAQAATLRAAVRRSELIQQWANGLASKRRLATYGVRGELVTFDPALHDCGVLLIQRSSPVRVATPGVTRAVEGRSTTIVIKAMVERP